MAAMGLKIYAGRTLCLPIPNSEKPHLYISLTGARSFQEAKIVLANLTSRGSSRGYDNSTILRPGDHPFITGETVINYKDAFIANAAKILASVTSGEATFREDCDDELLERVQIGALKSDYIDPEVRKQVAAYLG